MYICIIYSILKTQANKNNTQRERERRQAFSNFEYTKSRDVVNSAQKLDMWSLYAKYVE